jgi:phosphonate transport system substrate-binding protein
LNAFKSLSFTSCQAPNANEQVRQILAYLGKRLGLPIHFVQDADWRDRERALDAGEINAGWICGLPYVWKADQPDPAIELLSAPVMAAPRYQDRPIYFSDVVVRSESPYRSFDQLRGAAWAYNEPRSHSGYNLTRYHLSAVSPHQTFFSRVIEAGSHERALRLVLRGRVDASAIDSTVLETELANQPDIASRLRVIEALGPGPIPPWVVHKSAPAALL